jgi:hypothetical protein
MNIISYNNNWRKNNYIYYFEVNRSLGKFYRVYAILERISKYELIVKIKNEYYSYHSTFDLTQATVSNTLLAFAYNKRLYQLPKVNKFSEDLLQERFKFMSKKILEKIAFNTPIIQNLTNKMNALQKELKSAYHLYQQNQHQTINFAESIPLPKKYELKAKSNQLEPLEKESNSNNDILTKPIGRCLYNHNRSKISNRIRIPILSKKFVSKRKMRKYSDKFFD